jgi:predicted hotdog family 3-hydroxylacyl-ACP dehydratase
VSLDRRWIESHIPHQGGMCLLDEVLTWDVARIRCRTSTHRAATNPLRSEARLGAVCGIEYAAQAMAVHGALIASRIGMRSTDLSASSAATPGPQVVGYLASVRNVALYASRLDDVETDLVATAERVTGDERTVLYDFSVLSGERALIKGRATIVFSPSSGDLSLSSRANK